ncbi:hypothetical protein [Helicobacter sp. T3_23-1059]
MTMLPSLREFVLLSLRADLLKSAWQSMLVPYLSARLKYQKNTNPCHIERISAKYLYLHFEVFRYFGFSMTSVGIMTIFSLWITTQVLCFSRRDDNASYTSNSCHT